MSIVLLEYKGVPTRSNSDIFAPAELGCNISVLIRTQEKKQCIKNNNNVLRNLV